MTTFKILHCSNQIVRRVLIGITATIFIYFLLTRATRFNVYSDPSTKETLKESPDEFDNDAGNSISEKEKLVNNNDKEKTDAQLAFERIYDSNMWANAESRSGDGSTQMETVKIRKFIEFNLNKFKIKSFLDAPCGDFNWQHLVPQFNNGSVLYTGIDIVPELAFRNQRKYLNKKNFRFAQWDMSKDLIPKNTFDMIMIRDMIQHNSFASAFEIIKNVDQSGAKYFMTNFHSFPGSNRDISPGDFYPINVLEKPFSFPKPLFYVMDGNPVHHKYMGVWKLPVFNLGKGVYLPPNEDPEAGILSDFV